MLRKRKNCTYSSQSLKSCTGSQAGETFPEAGRVTEAQYWEDMLVPISIRCTKDHRRRPHPGLLELPQSSEAVRTSLHSPSPWPQACSHAVYILQWGHLFLLIWPAPPYDLAEAVTVMSLHRGCLALCCSRLICGSASASPSDLFSLQLNISSMNTSVTLIKFLFPFSSVLLWTAFLW